MGVGAKITFRECSTFLLGELLVKVFRDEPGNASSHTRTIGGTTLLNLYSCFILRQMSSKSEAGGTVQSGWVERERDGGLAIFSFDFMKRDQYGRKGV